MKNAKLLLIFLLVGILSSSCAKVFYSQDAKTLSNKHKNIAILPPSVSIAASKKVDAAALIEQQKTESVNFQNEMYSWLLKRKMQGKLAPEIQDISNTNVKLKEVGYPENLLSTSEYCELLGVDGIIESNYALSKPMSQGAAIAIGILFGEFGSTNEVKVSLSIKDCENKKLIFNYDHKYSGSIGSSASRLVDELMRDASQKMPYTLKN